MITVVFVLLLFFFYHSKNLNLPRFHEIHVIVYDKFLSTVYGVSSSAHVYLNVLEHDSPAPGVLVFHQPLGVLSLLVRSLLEVIAESRESHIVSVEVEGLQRADDKSVRINYAVTHDLNDIFSLLNRK